MQKSKTILITIEGIDCSGKTTIAKSLAKKFKYKFEHEPRFSSEEADKLNFNGIDHYQREFYFMQDRVKHQIVLEQHNVILDSYILRGLTYASYFGPKALGMVRSVYKIPEFKKPNLTIVIKTDPKTALKINKQRIGTPDYNPKLTLEVLKGLDVCMQEEIGKINTWKHYPSIIVIENKADQLEWTKKLVEQQIIDHVPELGGISAKKK